MKECVSVCVCVFVCLFVCVCERESMREMLLLTSYDFFCRSKGFRHHQKEDYRSGNLQ